MPEFSRYRQPSSTESDVAQDLPDRSPPHTPLEEVPQSPPPTDSMKAEVDSLEKRKVILFKDITKQLPEPLDAFMDIYARMDPENIKIAEACPDTCHIQEVFAMIPPQFLDVVPSTTYKEGEDLIIDWEGSKDYYSEKIIDTVLSEGVITKDHAYVKKYVHLGDAEFVSNYIDCT